VLTGGRRLTGESEEGEPVLSPESEADVGVPVLVLDEWLVVDS